MFQYNCLNPIANVGLDLFGENYTKTDDMKAAQAVLVRSAAMHDLELPEGLEAVVLKLDHSKFAIVVSTSGCCSILLPE